MPPNAKLPLSTRDLAEQALGLMRGQGFDAAQVDASRRLMTELNIAHNAPSLLRSTEQHRLQLAGIVDGRSAATELSDLSESNLRQSIATLHAQACAAPQDEANAVSSGQQARIVQGPLESQAEVLADAIAGLLAFRAAQTPTMMLQEGTAAHQQLRSHTLTTGGSDLSCRLGWYELTAVGNARDNGRSSSFNFAGGATHDLAATPPQLHFGIASMMSELTRQTQPQKFTEKFSGDVLLTPRAVASILAWLLGQIGDLSLLAGSSLMRDRVGQVVASALLNLRSRFDAPGVAAVSADAFATPPLELLRDGRLMTLAPSLYGSRKTGLPHCPVAGSGWQIEPGATPLDEMQAGVARGALVGRLSMGMPAASGDFSGVIKNSFALIDGRLGHALADTMITGNMAQMLRDVLAVSRERIDTGALCLPWLRIGGLHFS